MFLFSENRNEIANKKAMKTLFDGQWRSFGKSAPLAFYKMNAEISKEDTFLKRGTHRPLSKSKITNRSKYFIGTMLESFN